MKRNLQAYLAYARSQVVILVCWVVLLAIGTRRRDLLCEFLARACLWIPPAVAFSLYALVHVEFRYVGPFIVLMWAALLPLVRLPDRGISRRLLSTISILVVVLMSLQTGLRCARNAIVGVRAAREQMEIVRRAKGLGILPGNKIAVLNAGLGAQWQRLCRISIVAEIPASEEQTYWAAAPETRARVHEALAKAGARFLVAEAVPFWAIAAGWSQLGKTPVYVLRLSTSSPSK